MDRDQSGEAASGSDRPPRPAAWAPKEGQLVSGKYRLGRLIARGGMGAVWAGVDMTLERPVAIKFMDQEIAASEALRARFNREAKAAAQLNTPHVVQIHEHGVHEGLPYIVMELLEGEDLHARLKREKRLPLRTAARILTQAAKALKKAHGRGIVHRDLKPPNIFLARQDDEEVVKILDFGIAKSTRRRDRETESTKTGLVLGSPHYMSPEQARGLKNIDHRSDLWSLGVILYRAITGKLAFTGEATGDIIVKICTAGIPLPSQINPAWPRALDSFFERAMAQAPVDRFASAMDMAQAFADIAETAHDVAMFTPAPASGEGIAETTPGQPALPPQPDPSNPEPPSSAPVPISGSSAVTPPPVTGTALPSFTDPSPYDMRRRARRWLPWLIGGVSVVGGVLALVLTTGHAPDEPPLPGAARAAEASAEHTTPTEPDGPPAASPKPDHSAEPTASTKAPAPDGGATADPETEPSARRPQRPKSNRNWGY